MWGRLAHCPTANLKKAGTSNLRPLSLEDTILYIGQLVHIKATTGELDAIYINHIMDVRLLQNGLMLRITSISTDEDRVYTIDPGNTNRRWWFRPHMIVTARVANRRRGARP